MNGCNHLIRVGVMGHVADTGQNRQICLGKMPDHLRRMHFKGHDGIGIAVNKFHRNVETRIVHRHVNDLRAEAVDLRDIRRKRLLAKG